MPERTLTIREHLEAITQASGSDSHALLNDAYKHAVAALDLLTNAETWQDGSWLNPDPPMRYCLVPDPERGAP